MIDTSDPKYGMIYRDVISHSVTGEAVGIEHYSRMIPLTSSVEERLDLLEDAYREKAHLLSMRDVGKKLGLPVKTDLDGFYWKQVRMAFKERADAGDLLCCYIMQDIIIEIFAMLLYEAVIPASTMFAARRLRRIAEEERTHLAHGVRALKEVYGRDPEGMRERVEFANERVARVLAEWTGPDKCGTSCGVCNTECAKLDLHLLEMDMPSIQARFIDEYGKSLREIGLPAADITRWLARLPV